MTTAEVTDIQLFDKSDKIYGLTYGQWTVKWWDWIMPIPDAESPLNDKTGSRWKKNQPSSDVWFLIGDFAEDPKKKKPYTRVINDMDSGRSVLIPVLNCMATFLEYGGEPWNLKTHEDLLNHVAVDVSSVVKKDLFINDERYDPIRVSSDPKITQTTIIPDNAFGIKNFGVTDAAAEGYWAFIKLINKGHYTIRLEGSCESGRLCAGAAYEIDVI
ncbi:MAG TPA: hypothetical protein VJS91_06950 [Nitrososphaeraceae archaeon]|nr:hypothetical protein [Nitrososphaeraceae archaeon]